MRTTLRRPGAYDYGLAVLFACLGLAETALGHQVSHPWLHVVLTCAAMVSLAWRRRAPVPVALVVLVADLAVNPQDQYTLVFALALATFTVGDECDPPCSYVGLALIAGPFVLAMVSSGLHPSDLAAALLFVVGPWIVGTVSRQRAATTRAAVQRASRAETEAELLTRLAVQEERTRIARELHDVVSHSISVIAIQAQAVRFRLRDDQSPEVADLAALEEVARDAMAEMRRLFGVLRSQDGAATLAPQPGLRQLDALVAGIEAGGLTVEREVVGTPYPLSPGLDLTVFRVIQEALTNALRHARASVVRVRIEYAVGRLRLEVADDGCGLPDPLVNGHGVPGMRERVALYDGTVSVQTGTEGGTRLLASWPTRVIEEAT